MSEELLARLRTTAGNPAICKDAAATIERLTRERDEARESIENAGQAASETQSSWKHRCYAILAALGLNYGDPDIPDERAEALAAELAKAREALAGILRNHETIGAGASIFQCTTAEVEAARAAMSAR
jgi:hypothetical protein